ncbi:MAG: hypothetical protein B7Z18_08520 [Alishewanella sp. 32-51-5]|nr:MAG: hypothetical protein B7Z18_08520 [Alishewanella sp. 32-51-5]
MQNARPALSYYLIHNCKIDFLKNSAFSKKVIYTIVFIAYLLLILFKNRSQQTLVFMRRKANNSQFILF